MGEVLKMEVSAIAKKIFVFLTGGVVVYNLDTLEQVTVIREQMGRYSSTFDLSPDGSLLAISNKTGKRGDYGEPNTKISVLSTGNGELQQELEGEDIGCPLKSEFSPNNKILAFVSYCNGIPRSSRTILWEIMTGNLLWNAEGTWDVTFSPNSTFFATAGYEDYGIKVFEVHNSKVSDLDLDLPKSAGWHTQVIFLPGGNQLAGMYERDTYIWQIPDGKVLHQFYGRGCFDERDFDQSRYLSETNTFLRAGCQYINIFDLTTDKTLYYSTSGKYNPDVSYDGTRMLAGSFLGDYYYWYLYEIPGAKLLLKGDNTKPFFSQDGKYIIDAWTRKTLVHSATDGAFLYQLEGIQPVDLADGRIATVGIGQLLIWNIEDGSLIREVPLPNTGKNHRFTLDSKSLVEEFDQGLRITDTQSLTTKIISGPFLTYSDNGALAVMPVEKGIQVLKTSTGEVLQTFNTGYDEYWSLLSPDGSIVVTQMKYKFRLWQVESGKELFSIPLSGYSGFKKMIITSDNHYVLINTYDDVNNETQTITIWEIPTGYIKKQFEAVIASGSIYNRDTRCNYWLTFSPDEKFAAYSQISDDKKGCTEVVFRISDFQTVNQFYIGYGKDWEGKMAALSKDGLYLATGFLKAEVRFWSVLDGKQIGIWNPSTVEERQVVMNQTRTLPVFSPDGRLLAITIDGVMYLKGIPEN